MEIKIFNTLCDEALQIRMKVFCEEQGFVDEVDEIDSVATHFVMYSDNSPVATCRVFEKEGKHILGRLAVVKSRRKQGIGSMLLTEVEKHIKSLGVTSLCLHSQLQAVDFYKKCGYISFGEIELEEDCPHIWMKKTFNN